MVTSGEVNPEPGGGERQKEAGHLVKMSGVWGCCDAGDVVTASSASSASSGAQEAIYTVFTRGGSSRR